MDTLDDLQNMLNAAADKMPAQLLTIIEVEGLNFIEKNFRDQGFNDQSLEKWQERATEDTRGRDITRYRTNRVGKRGDLNRYGSKNKDRNILVGHNTGGDKLKNSFKGSKEKDRVRFYTYKKYAKRHNEGIEMPKRQFMGKSKYLDMRYKTKLTQVLNKLLK